MVLSAVFRIVRQRVGALDAEVASALEDAQLAVRVEDAIRYFSVQQVSAFADHVVDLDSFEVDDTVSPELPDDLGLIAAYWIANQILADSYRGRLQRGEFGVLWRSGLEEESTATAARFYDGQIAKTQTELRELLLVYHRNAQGSRIY